MTPPDLPKKELRKRPKKKDNLLRNLGVVLFFAVAALVGFDGYVNRWGLARSAIHWNSLELQGRDGSRWNLTAKSHFQLLKVSDPRQVLVPESLVVFDRPLRDSGYYRLYFRLSDSSSAKLQKLYQTLIELDSTGSVRRSVEEVKTSYGKFRRFFRLDTSKTSDTVTIVGKDSAQFYSSTNQGIGSEEEISKALNRFMKNPQLLIGIGVGVLLTAGIDVLQGDAFVAISKENVFRTDSLLVGTRSGEWEGKSIDILWAFAKEDTLGKTWGGI